jgi:hypothetical protein
LNRRFLSIPDALKYTNYVIMYTYKGKNYTECNHYVTCFSIVSAYQRKKCKYINNKEQK